MNFEVARPRIDDPLLIYSLAEFQELIFEGFEIAGVRQVVEIGSEAGLFTERLIRWTADQGGKLVSIDPATSDHVRTVAARFDHVTLLEKTSVDALPELPAMDAYLIDGDHNYSTVSQELRLIHEACQRAGRRPLLYVQDVAWPCGRRDQYYNPESMDSRERHPYEFAGVVPWSEGTTTHGGFRGNGEFAVARTEGGAHNGVGTAVDDFLAEHPGYRFIAVPYVFGMAIVFPGDAEWADALWERLGSYHEHPVLARLEANRLRLYLEVLALTDTLSEERVRNASAIAALEADLEEARTQRAIAEQVARRALESERAQV